MLELEPLAPELQPLPARVVVSAAVWAPGPPRAQVHAQRPVQRRVQEPASGPVPAPVLESEFP